MKQSESFLSPECAVRDFQLEPGYDFIREIARGGYGYVYLFRANQTPLPDYVAGKFVYRDLFCADGDETKGGAYERALEGLQNFRSLSAESPYLLRVFDVRQRHEEGHFCYIMELADDLYSGRKIDPPSYRPRTLKNELERQGPRQRLPVRRCLEIAASLARGLKILHESGFTHRDVRPSNIIFVDDVPKLADIDLLAGNEAAVTSYIPEDYAAPERSHSKSADLFSFGKTFYEMVTGLPVRAFPTLPSNIRFWEDHALLLKVNKIIIRACAQEVQKRYESVEQMLHDLESVC